MKDKAILAHVMLAALTFTVVINARAILATRAMDWTIRLAARVSRIVTIVQ